MVNAIKFESRNVLRSLGMLNGVQFCGKTGHLSGCAWNRCQGGNEEQTDGPERRRRVEEFHRVHLGPKYSQNPTAKNLFGRLLLLWESALSVWVGFGR